MARVKVELPERLPFKTSMPVSIGDVNYGGHLGNDSMLTLVQEARLRFLKSKGMSETDAGGVGMTMCDATVCYKAEAFHGDELEFEMGVSEIGVAGFGLACRVSRRSDGAEIARVLTNMAFFDYAKRKLARTPEAFLKAFSEPQP